MLASTLANGCISPQSLYSEGVLQDHLITVTFLHLLEQLTSPKLPSYRQCRYLQSYRSKLPSVHEEKPKATSRGEEILQVPPASFSPGYVPSAMKWARESEPKMNDHLHFSQNLCCSHIWQFRAMHTKAVALARSASLSSDSRLLQCYVGWVTR